MPERVGDRKPPEIVELHLTPGRTLRQFQVAGGATDNDAIDAVAAIIAEGQAHPKDSNFEACPPTAIRAGEIVTWIVDVCYRRRRKVPGRNPPEPVERRPEPTPAPPLPCKWVGVDCPTCMFATTCDQAPPWATGGDAESARGTIERLLAKLERIPCMSTDCDGIEDAEAITKDRPAPTRCHRCAAVRLARSVIDGRHGQATSRHSRGGIMIDGTRLDGT